MCNRMKKKSMVLVSAFYYLFLDIVKSLKMGFVFGMTLKGGLIWRLT